MKTTIDQLANSIGEIKKSINNKYINQKEEAPVNDTTLLSEYASLIDGIKTEVVDISQQIFVFYCYADSPHAAEAKEFPRINWDDSSKKWNIECTLGEWCTNVNEASQNKPDGTYLYAMFVSVNTNTSKSNINWPDPVRLEGVPGKDGEKGDPGLDGILAGAILRNISPVYIYSESVPEISTVSYDSKGLSNLNPNNISVNGKKLSEKSTSEDNKDWSLSYSGAKNIWRIDIQYSSNSSDAVVLGDPVLITDTIQINVKYSYNEDGDWYDEALTPSPDRDKQIVYRKTTMVTDSGEEYETIDVASQYSKSITNVEYKYGTSEIITQEPTEWSDLVPNTDKTIWAKRTETFSDGTTKTITYPIGLRGPAGIQYVSWVKDEDELKQVDMSLYNEDDYVGKIAVKVNHDIYIWYGSNGEYIPGIKEVNSQYWLNIGSLAPIPDWNAKESENGHVKNRTHYVETIIDTFGYAEGDTWTQIFVPTSAFNITISNGSITKQWDNIWCILEDSLPDGVSFVESYNTYEFDSATDRWECSYQIIHQLDPKFVPQMIETTYSELKSWRDNNQLIPGMKYRITDYETTTTQENTTSAGYMFDIIVTALDEKTLSEEAHAIQNKSELYFKNRNLAAWKIWYSLDNKWWTSDKLFELLNGEEFIINSNNMPLYVSNDTTYFIKSEDTMIKVNMSQASAGSFNNLQEYYNSNHSIVTPKGSVDCTLLEQHIQDIDGNEYVVLESSNSEKYIIKKKLWENSRTGICLISNGNEIPYTITYVSSKGIIYRMIDEFGNDFPFDFQNISIMDNLPIGSISSPNVKNNVCKTKDSVIPFISIYITPPASCSNNLFICSNDLDLLVGNSSDGNTFVNCEGTYQNVNFSEFRSCTGSWSNESGSIILKNTELI